MQSPHNSLKFILSESQYFTPGVKVQCPADEKYQFLHKIWGIMVSRHTTQEMTDWWQQQFFLDNVLHVLLFLIIYFSVLQKL